MKTAMILGLIVSSTMIVSGVSATETMMDGTMHKDTMMTGSMMKDDTKMMDSTMMKKDMMTMDMSKMSLAQIAKHCGYTWSRDRVKLAKMAGIKNYRGTAKQNLAIRAYLLSDKGMADAMKMKESMAQ